MGQRSREGEQEEQERREVWGLGQSAEGKVKRGEGMGVRRSDQSRGGSRRLGLGQSKWKDGPRKQTRRRDRQ